MPRLLSILLISFLYQISNMTTRPMVPLMAQSMGAGSHTIGLLVAVQAFFPFLLAIPIGQMTDLLGARKVLFYGSILTCVSGVLYLYAPGIGILFSAQVISGIGQLLVWLGCQTIATQMHSSVNGRDSFVGYFGSFSAVGQFVAPILAGVLADAYGYHTSLGILVILGAFIFFLSLPLPSNENNRGKRQNVSSQNVYSDAWYVLVRNHGVQLAVISSFVPIFVTAVRTSFFPLYLKNIHFSNTSLGLVVALGSLSTIFCRASMGVMICLLTRRVVLFASMFMAVVAMALVPFFESFGALGFLSAISGWGSGINEPITISLIAAYTLNDKRGVALGLRMAGNRLAMFGAPLFFSAFMKYTGLASAFYATGFLLISWCVGTLFFVRQLRLGSDLGMEHGACQVVGCKSSVP